MDEALELNEYLPYSMAAANEQSYLQFLWSAFESNYQQGRYEFAKLAFHLLYMSFVSFSIWRNQVGPARSVSHGHGGLSR